jgi:hypothetical protein
LYGKMPSLCLKPINDLLGEQFFIPAYQRGYRWTHRQVPGAPACAGGSRLTDDEIAIAKQSSQGKKT